MVTRSVSFGPTDTVAATETTIGSAYTFAKTGRIRQIRISGYEGVIAKEPAGILYLSFKKLSGPFEFAIGGMIGLVTTSGGIGWIPTEVIDVDIPVDNGEQITVSAKTVEILESVTVSLTIVE